MPWPMFQHVERQAVRMHEMMRRLDVDISKLVRLDNGDVYAQARKRCLACGTCGLCLRWLDKQGRQDRLPEFCPNLQTFLKCRQKPDC